MPKSVAATAATVHELATTLQLDRSGYQRALELAGLTPDPADWRRWLDRFLAAAGALFLLAGIAAFFAWNWAELDRLVKFGLVEAGIVAAVLLAWFLKLDSTAGRAALFAGGFLVGVLLAVVGQEYQTGADPYTLFLVWALLILPWALVGRQTGLWLLFVVLLDVALILYWSQVLDPPHGWWVRRAQMAPLGLLEPVLENTRLSLCLFVMQIVALALWEFFAQRGVAWLQGRAAPRLLGLATILLILVPTIVAVIDLLGRTHELLPMPVFAFTAATFLIYYRIGRRDLFMLTIVLFAAILVLTTLGALTLGEVDAPVAGFLLLTMLFIAMCAGATWWLRQLAGRWEVSA